jgi:ATP-binding cassette subfamily B protein
VQSGRITVDGTDVMDITLESLRRNIGMVSQNVFLFDGTVRDNIAYARPDASDEEIVDAAKKANIHEFILTLDNGYDTEVGERGVKLSGGQRQRISIARVFLKNPKLLILDEATSALDNVTEMQIQASLEELSHGRTVIVVAHRLSTVKNADEIIVIDKSGIVERGSHEDLIAKDGEYSKLYSYQFKAL